MHGKIKQLFMISCAFVPLFFNANAFYFLSRCQAHACGLHRPFVDKNKRNAPRRLGHSFQKYAKPQGGFTRFYEKRLRTGGVSFVFEKNS